MKLIVIAKSPAPGRSKTRLCPPCTPEEAASVALAALEDTLDTCRKLVVEDLVLALDGPPGAWTTGFRVLTQRGGTLDERIANAFAGAGSDTDGSLLIGMDTPQVTGELLDGAFETLSSPGVDGVLGPTEDGGWWAMGLRRPTSAHIVGVPMSAPDTLSCQRERWNVLGVRRRELPQLTDIDTFEVARSVAGRIPGSRTATVVDAIVDRMVPAW